MSVTYNEKGLVSLFTTIMISLLLIIITTSMVTLEVLQLRKAGDSEQSLRAYYIAEAGVEDAVSKVLSNPTNRVDQPCSSNTTYDSAGTAGWTCQRISYSGSSMGTLSSPDISKTIDPGHVASPYRSVIIEWNQSPAAGNYTVPNSLPSALGYGPYPAPPLEVAMVTYPPGGFSASQLGSQVKLENALIVPRGNGLYEVDATQLPGHGQWDANCGMSGRSYNPGNTAGLGGYNCYAVITNLSPNDDHLFRIRSRYLSTTYRVTFKQDANGNGPVIQVPDGTATIDVTAKAGASHRRVLTKLPLGNSAASGLDYVIYSDTDICKNFNIINNAWSPPGC